MSNALKISNVTANEKYYGQFKVIENKNYKQSKHNNTKEIEQAMVKGYLRLLTGFYSN